MSPPSPLPTLCWPNLKRIASRVVTRFPTCTGLLLALDWIGLDGIAQCFQDLVRCLVDVDLMVLPVDFIRDVLELRERAVLALGNITSLGLPPHDPSGTYIHT